MFKPVADRRTRMMLAGLWAWVGLSVALAALTLSSFMTDRAAFGQTVSGLFRAQAWLGLGCALLLLVLIRKDVQLNAPDRRTQQILVIVGLVCILGYFGLQPVMAALREGAGPGGVMASSARQQFGMLHWVSMLLYLVQTVMAVWLLIKTRK